MGLVWSSGLQTGVHALVACLTDVRRQSLQGCSIRSEILAARGLESALNLSDLLDHGRLTHRQWNWIRFSEKVR